LLLFQFIGKRGVRPQGAFFLASVTVDDVRDVINISSAEVPDAKILKMLKRAEVTLELELGKIRDNRINTPLACFFLLGVL